VDVRAATAMRIVRSSLWGTGAAAVALEGGASNVVQRSSPPSLLLQRFRRAAER
jgi:hypothetical protein